MPHRRVPTGWTAVFVAVAVVLVAMPARGQSERRAPYVRLFSGLGVTGASDLRIRQPVLAARGESRSY